MVTNDVAGLSDGAGDFRMLSDVTSDEEKSCVHVVFGEDVEKAQSVRVVGAVVVGEGELAGVVAKAGKSLSAPLGGWSDGLIARGDGDCGGSCAG